MGMTVKSQYLQYLIVGLILAILIGAQNCSDSGQVAFSRPSKSLTSSAASGGVDGFDGKPLPGDYIRTYPNYICASQPNLGIQGLLTVKDNLTVTSDNCNNNNYIFPFDSKLLEFNSYNLDYLGVGTATYERIGTTVAAENPIVDVWCQFNSDTTGFDIVVKSKNDLSNSQGKIYLGLRPDLSSPWTSRKVLPSDLLRSETADEIIFQSSGIFLEITKSADASILATGSARALVDGLEYNVNSLSCRTTNLKPIEDMGTQLTSLGSLNLLTTDAQESVCAQPGVFTCENFENRSPKPAPASFSDYPAKFKLSGFNFQVTNGAALVADGNMVDGTKAQEWTFATDMITAGLGDVLISPSKEVFSRFYIKFSTGFVFSTVQTNFVSMLGSNSTLLFGLNSNRTPSLGLTQGGSTDFFSSSAGPLANPDQWKCIEIHMNVGTPNTGIVEMWIDGSRVISRVDLNFNETAINYFRADMGWTCNSGGNTTSGFCQNSSDPLNHHPAQSIYLDNIVIANQRIGCF